MEDPKANKTARPGRSKKTAVNAKASRGKKSSAKEPPDRPTLIVTFNLGDIKSIGIQPGLQGWVIPNPPRPPRLDAIITIELYKPKK